MMRQSFVSASVLALASSVLAGPVQRRDFGSFGGFSGDIVPVYAVGNDVFDSSSLSVSQFSSSHSFDLWGGISSLNGFDNFFGADNFCGSNNVQTFVSESVQCVSVDVTVIQQQLAIITEFAKRIITSEICEVETQTIVLQQWISGLQSFSSDIRRVSSRTVSFDSSIASRIGDLCDSNGDLVTSDFGFDGTSIGSHSVTIEGCEWDSSKVSIVEQAFQDCEQAAGFSLDIPSYSSISSSCGSDCSLMLPPSSSSCSSSDCGVSVSSDCGSDCSVSSLPPTSDCGSDCSVSSLPPTSDCGSDCSVDAIPSSGVDSAGVPLGTVDPNTVSFATDSAGDALPTDSAGDAALPTDSAGDAALPTDDSSDVAALPTDDATDAATPTDTADVGAVTSS